ncbi:MAG: nuclear transport factor 2 family protein [Proteobacteria bacterium]|nr:nuclear transport factor 2 family protein [Pseudomonadota bacterium]
MAGFIAPPELRELAHRYAWAVDRRDAAAIVPLFTRDGAVRGHGANPIDYTGPARLAAMMDDLGMFEMTMHNVFNQLFERDADGAVTGVTYCVASHLLPGENPVLVDMAIWYHDRFEQEDGAWKFAERRLEVRWTENRPARRFDPAMMSGSAETLK